MKLSNLYLLVFILIISILAIVVVLRYLGFFANDQGLNANRRIVISDLDSVPQSNTEAPQVNPPVDNTNKEYKLEVVVDNLFVPWSIVFTSDSRMLFTERNGKLNSFENGEKKLVKDFSEVKGSGEEGLMSIALDTQYPSNKLIYICLAYPSGGGFLDKVVRFKDDGDKLSEEKVLLDKIPAASNHAGCRIKFGPDQKLYITTGDATKKEIAQDKNSLGGKILRINSDGSIPTDNPFDNSPVWTLGHRNAQGIDWHPLTGELFETEHGPSGFDGPGGGDEINIIKGGNNYGWPIVSHERSQQGLIDPLLVFTPAVAPAAALFYRGDVLSEFKSNLFVGLLRGEGILRVVLDDKDSSKVKFYEKLKFVNVGRVREVMEGPDGNIYFSTSNRDGRGTVQDKDDKIYRIVLE